MGRGFRIEGDRRKRTERPPGGKKKHDGARDNLGTTERAGCEYVGTLAKKERDRGRKAMSEKERERTGRASHG